MSRAYKTEPAMKTCSVADSSIDNNSRNSEIAIHTLLVETQARDLDREV